MLQEKLKDWRQAGKKILVCCCGEKKAEEMWQKAGGKAGNILTPRQVESWLFAGGGSLPNELCFTGSLSEFMECFPKENIAESKRKVNSFLAGGVAMYEEEKWVFFSCRAVVGSCCMGKYLSVADKKEQ